MTDTNLQPPLSEPKKKSKKKIIWIVIAAVIALIVIVQLSSGGDSSDSSTDSSDTAASTTVEEVTEEVPVEEISEEVAEEAPAEAPADNSAYYADTFGDFAPIAETGSGDAIINLPAGATGGIVTASHDGSSNFAISLLDATNQSTGDLLVNTIGAYQGTTAYGISSFGEPVKMEVSADGAWSIEVAPMSAAPVLNVPTEGSGDAVFRYEGPAADWAVSHSGDSNFVLLQTADIFPNLAVNEIGNYNGTVPMQPGPSIVTVQADGNWSIS